MLRQRSKRGYELLPQKEWIVVIRLKGLEFASSQPGPQRRQLRETATGPYGASRAKGSGLSFLSEDTNNVILDACGANDADTSAATDAP